MTIRHLVISGGGPILIQFLGAIQELEKHGYMNMNNIRSIYGTSAGAALAVMLSLRFEWETLNDYILKRPWQDVFPIGLKTVFESYSKRGLFDSNTVELCFKPLFLAKDIPLDITLKDFYGKTGIDLHFFSFEINSYQLEDISHTTHPNIPLLQAIHMTCALPGLISPVLHEGKCYMDGGAACNYPLTYCLHRQDGKHDEILGFKNSCGNRILTCNEDSTLFDYLLYFVVKAVFHVNHVYAQPTISNEVICDSSYMSVDVLTSTLNSAEIRQDLFEKGTQSASQFLAKQHS